MNQLKFLALFGAAALPCLSLAVIYLETEPNDSWESPNVITSIEHGDRVQGHVYYHPAQRDIDTWSIGVSNEPTFGIYEYSLRYEPWDTSNADRHYHRIMLNDSRFNTPYPVDSHWGASNNGDPYKIRFYSFGSNGNLPYQIGDTTQGLAGSDYDIVWERNAVTPFSIGVVQAGSMTLSFTRRGTSADTNTSVAFFDASGNFIPGTGRYQGLSNYSMTFTLLPGTYYVAFSGEMYGSEPYALPQVFEDSSFMTGFSSAYGGLQWTHALTLTSGASTIPINYETTLASKGWAGMTFGKLTVVPEPASVLGLSAALLGILKVRRTKRD